MRPLFSPRVIITVTALASPQTDTVAAAAGAPSGSAIVRRSPARVAFTGTDITAAFWRLLAIAFSIAAASLPSACAAPFTTTCGV